jgi:MOSC domain-containing protein
VGDDGTVGTVSSLWRYPVKSMQGEELAAVDVTGRGIVGDRAYAVVDDETGKVASAKHPRKWSAVLSFRASFVDAPSPDMSVAPPVEVVFPDGSVHRSDDVDIDAALSDALGRRVTLQAGAPAQPVMEEVWPSIEGLAPGEFIAQTRVADDPEGVVSDIPMGLTSPPGTFFDLAVLHVMTTATLDQLAALAPECEFDVRRYRPNLVVDVEPSGFVENAWAGKVLSIGDIQVAGSIPTMRCVMTTLAQPGLTRDVRTLQAIATHNRVEISGLGTWACAGLYADVRRGGRLARGDAVRVADGA